MWEMAGLGAALAGGLWYSTQYAWWRRSVPDRFPRILMYHMIQPHRVGARYNKLRVPPSLFDQQLRWLRDNGWRSCFISDLADDWRGAGPGGRRVAITFDDGYHDNLTEMLPLLERHDARATVYLVGDRSSGRDWSRQKKTHHDSGELRDEPKLSDEDVNELLASGRIELGSHTMTHLHMGRAPREVKLLELAASKQWLENRFGVTIRSFAYPFGIYASGDPDLVREAGYTNAVTTLPGINDSETPNLYELRRVKVGGRETMRDFRLRMRTGWRAWNK